MKKFKIVGTKGKKRKKALRLLVIPLIAAAAVLAVLFLGPFGAGNAGALAQENGSGPGGGSSDDQDEGGALCEDVSEDETALNRAGDTGKDGSVSKDEREISFGPIGIGPNIKTGDYIDVRLMCADGTDYVVVSKKELIDYNASTGMSVIRVRESELLTLNSAMADRNGVPGVTLYAARYIDPFAQSAADVSYQPNDAVSDQIREREYDIGR
ncbi:MAG: hypothetical protein K6E95_03665 [Lachnospiraceae bacterium]|nr:hypothetical protein [Lachnospiraceae bacterium]